MSQQGIVHCQLTENSVNVAIFTKTGEFNGHWCQYYDKITKHNMAFHLNSTRLCQLVKYDFTD